MSGRLTTLLLPLFVATCVASPTHESLKGDALPPHAELRAKNRGQGVILQDDV
jgi:hypothetical protein